MLDLFLGIVLTRSLADGVTSLSNTMIAQQTRVFLSVSTRQSTRLQCTGFTARNNSGRKVQSVYVNYTDNTGRSLRRFLASSLGSGETITFDMCQGPSSSENFVNVEAKQ
jgi:hypothetical protein